MQLDMESIVIKDIVDLGEFIRMTKKINKLIIKSKKTIERRRLSMSDWKYCNSCLPSRFYEQSSNQENLKFLLLMKYSFNKVIAN